MIRSREDLIQVLFSVEPNFKEEYQRRLSASKRPPTLSGDASDFSHFVKDRLREGHYENAEKVFQTIESLLEESASSDSVKDALCTCFLENLLNFFTEESEDTRNVHPHVGCQI